MASNPNKPALDVSSLADFPRKPPGVWPPPIKWRRWRARRELTEEALAQIPAAWREDRRTLHSKCVMVMGLGAVGGVCFEQLAKLGVGRLYGFDPDRYGEESWLTQPALLAQRGQRKIDVQGRRASLANPWAEIAVAPAFAQDVPLAVLEQADVLVLAGDNLELLIWASEYAAGLGKAVVQGAVHGPSHSACVRGFDRSDPQAVCPICLIGESEWSRTTSRMGCDPATLRLQGLEPTQTLPHVCATAGQMVTAEVLKWLLKRDETALSGAEVQYNLLGHRSLRTAFTRKENCRGPHRRWRVVKFDRPLGKVTLADLAALAEAESRSRGERVVTRGASDPHWSVKAEIPWITRASCWECGKVFPVRRFSRLGRKVARCSCGGAVWSDLDGRRSIIPPEDRDAAWKVPLAKLGLKPGDSLAFCRDEDWTWFILS